MADDNDFIALYRALGLAPDCTMAQFRHAYRQRVRMLHPDHAAGPADTLPQLQRLNRLYAAALEFERRHGRLPGALPAATARLPRQHAPRPADPGVVAGAGRVAAPKRRLRYLLLVALSMLAMFHLQRGPSPDTSTVAAAPAAMVVAGDAPPAHRDPGMLEVGMDGAQVRQIQGIPFNAYETRWDYGPSWIDFKCGRVSGWYSSPLRPLRIGGNGRRAHGRKPVAARETPDCSIDMEQE